MLQIGWSTKDVTTDKPIVIPGQFHIRLSKGCLDSQIVCALVIDSGEDIVVFVQGDLASVRPGVLDAIRAKVKARLPEINTEKIIMNATHTHCGPLLEEGENLGTWGTLSTLPHDGVEITPPGEYFEFYTSQAADAVCEAYENRAEGSFGYGYGYAVVAHSRRTIYADDITKRPDATPGTVDGHCKAYGNTNDDKFSHYEAGADHFVNLLFTFDKNEQLTGAIINVPCPSQNSEMEEYMSADFWGDVRAMLKEKYGDIHIMAQCAAAGDLSPRVLHYKQAQDRRYRLKFADFTPDPRAKYPTELYNRRDIALRICEAFDEVYAWAQKEKFTDAPLRHSVKTIHLQRRMVTDAEYAVALADHERFNAEPFVPSVDKTPAENLHWNTRQMTTRNRRIATLKRYETQNESPTLPMELHAVRIGEIAFATNTFELFMDYQHRIQARSPFEQTFIVQLCGQPRGYINATYLATERGVQNKSYSASVYCNHVSAQGGATLVEQTLEELHKLAENKN